MASSGASLEEYWRRTCLAMNFIQDHLDEPLALEAIAEAAFLSKFYFHRIFHAMVGETVSAFTRRLRLEKSAGLLRYCPDKPITAIAYEQGFSSTQNFSKMFRKHFGVSPSQYRQAGRGEGAAPFLARYGPRCAGTYQQAAAGMDVVLERLPGLRVAYLRVVGSYKRQLRGAAHNRLVRWARGRGIACDGARLGIFLDNPEITASGNCRYDACMAVPKWTGGSGEVGLQRIPAGLYAVYRDRPKTITYGRDWEDLLSRWLPQSGFQPDDRPCYELWPKAAQTVPRVDICLPVKPL